MIEPTTATLKCLGGKHAPPEIAGDIGILATLPASARAQIYSVLTPCLGEVVPTSIDADIEQFSRVLGLDGASFARGLKASRFLVRHAAMMDLSKEDLREDLAELGDTGDIAEILTAGYEAAKAQVRSDVARATLADHGKLVERVDWRVDYVTTSNRGENLKMPVAVLTLGYREGELQRRVTVQLLPEALAELRAMCDRLL